MSIYIMFSVGYYYFDSPHYKDLHRQLGGLTIQSVKFSQYQHGSFTINDLKQRHEFAEIVQKLLLKSSYYNRRTSCNMTVALVNGKILYYTIYFDFGKRRAVLMLQGNPKYSMGNYSYGYYEDPDSSLFNWLTDQERFGSDSKKLQYCSDN